MTAKYPSSLALCVLDALWTDESAADSGTVGEVLAMYRELREEDWGDADTDGVRALAAQIETLGGPAYWTDQLKKRVPTASTRAEILRTNALVEACGLLASADVDTAEELRALDDEARTQLQRAWKRIAGQRSGRSFERLQSLVEV